MTSAGEHLYLSQGASIHRVIILMKTLLLFLVFLAAVAVFPAGAAPLRPDSSSIASFADSLFDYWIARSPTPIPGGVVAVANKRGTIFARGYGMADIEREEPFDPSTTAVRLASVTKIFTATAIAQLAAEGRIDIDAPAERYLAGLRFSSPFDTDVTVRHLLTHAAGFDESTIGLKTRTPEEIPSLADFLAGSLPPVVREPGTTFSYSNIGISLAARILETTTGEAFESIVRRRIFLRLDMPGTVFETEPPRPGTRLMRRYEYEGGGSMRFVPVERDYVKIRGSAGLRSTALDMSRFIRACLGGVDGVTLSGTVERATPPRAGISLAMEEHFAPCPALPRSMGLGWHRERRGGTIVAWHAGGNRGAGCFLFVAPERDLGFFIAWNHAAGSALQRAFLDGFVSRFAGPVDAPSPLSRARESGGDNPPAAQEPIDDATNLSGNWRYLPHSQTTIAKFARFPDGGLSIEAGPGDTLLVGGRPFVPADGGAFVYPPTGESLCFYGGGAGRPEYVSWNGLHTFRRLSALEKPATAMTIVVSSVLALVSLLALSIVAGIRNLAGKTARPRRVGAGSVCAAMLLIFLPLVRLGASSQEMMFDPPLSLKLLLAVPLVAIVPGAVFALRVFDEWRRGESPLAGRLHRTIVLAAILLLYWMMHAQNLLGWRW